MGVVEMVELTRAGSGAMVGFVGKAGIEVGVDKPMKADLILDSEHELQLVHLGKVSPSATLWVQTSAYQFGSEKPASWLVFRDLLSPMIQ